MPSLTVTAKGQITVRKALLEHLGVRPGEKIEVDVLPNGTLALRAARTAPPIADLFGCLAQPGKPTVSIEDMARIAAEGWAGKR